VYLLTAAQARDIIDAQVQTIRNEWLDAADTARLTSSERDRLWRRQILNDNAFDV
jgi:serine/threonine-protein kinase HipA